MLEHTKRQVHKWKFLQHALSRYVYNRSLCDIFTDGPILHEETRERWYIRNKLKHYNENIKPGDLNILKDNM